MNSPLSSSRPSHITSPTHGHSLDALFAIDHSMDSSASLHPVPAKELFSQTSGLQIPATTSHKASPTHTTASLPSCPTISHGSPFASHPFVPISGAPGFTGIGTGIRAFRRTGTGRGGLSRLSGGEYEGGGVDWGHCRFGEYVYVIRWVLMLNVISLRRFDHSPRRSPASHALYGFDQHGISLSTLFTRYENQYSKTSGRGDVTGGSGGALMVIKDSARCLGVDGPRAE